MDGSPQPSPALLAANRRLHALRQERREQRSAHNVQWTVDNERCPLAACAVALPPHLGWGSANLTAALRRGEGAVSSQCSVVSSQYSVVSSQVLVKPSLNTDYRPLNTEHWSLNTEHWSLNTQKWVKLYPDIGLAMLRREATAPGRLWLLLRLLDRAGSGKFRIVVVEEMITGLDSPHRLCGRRQLRNLLKAGDGLFWTRDRDTLWLRSAAKVAHELGVARLTGQPTALPLPVLLGGIGDFRAHLYAAFHSGRIKPNGRAQAMPITRQTLHSLSGVGRSSQRSYERRARVKTQTNYAVGETVAPRHQEERVWRQGAAVFTLKDSQGEQGKPGQSYLAWQLPNSYDGCHSQRPKGRQRRINRELKDLVMKGMPGNVEEEVGSPRYGHGYSRVFYTHGKWAAKAYGRDPHGDRYWPTTRTKQGQSQLWQRLGS